MILKPNIALKKKKKKRQKQENITRRKKREWRIYVSRNKGDTYMYINRLSPSLRGEGGKEREIQAENGVYQNVNTSNTKTLYLV
jgi:hypothetical protein